MAAVNVEESWQYNKTVLERNKHMLKNQLATDVTFLVGENPARRIPAHQYVLISGSPVFYSMFCGVLKERGEVNIPDITPDAFTQMLRYLYYEEADITGESVMEILNASKKYLIPGLTEKCISFLEKLLNGENAATILEQCHLFDEKEMVSKCMNVIGENTHEVLKSESFGNITNDTLVEILESDSCSVSEVELFKASVDWARGKLSRETPSGDRIRDTLGKALFKIRFPVMTANEFANVVVPADVLSKDEELLCFRYFCQDRKSTNMPFPTKPRVDNSCEYNHLKWNKTKVILMSTLFKFNPEFRIKNNTSRDMHIKGLVPCGDINRLYYAPTGHTNWRAITFLTQSGTICPHNKGKSCITFPVFTIPAGSSYDILMKSDLRVMRCTPTTSGLTFCNPTGTLSALVTGDVPIREILIAKSTT